MTLTDQQALKSAYAQNDVHGRHIRWLSFWAEFGFECQCRKENSSETADFLFRAVHKENEAEGVDEGHIFCAATSESRSEENALDLEESLPNAARHLDGPPRRLVTESKEASTSR